MSQAPDLTLNSPITHYTVDEVQKCKATGFKSPRYSPLIDHHPIAAAFTTLVPEMYHLLAEALSISVAPRHVARWTRAAQLAERLDLGVHAALSDIVGQKVTATHLNLQSACNSTSFRIYTNLLVVLERYRHAFAPNKLFTTTIQTIPFVFYKDLCTIDLNGTIFLMSIDQVRGIFDQHHSRFISFLCLPLVEENLASQLGQLYQWQDAVIARLGNQGYDMVKAVESIGRVIIGEKVDGADTGGSRLNLEAKLRGKFPDHQALVDDLVRILRMGLSRSTLELFGCVKHTTFPIMDEVGSASATRDKAKTADKSSYAACKELGFYLSHEILLSYIKREGKWPPMTFTKESKLKDLYRNGSMEVLYEEYDLSDWRTSFIEKIYDFDYCENYLELIDDKACGLPRSIANLFWDNPGACREDRRSVLKVLKELSIDTKELVNNYAAGRFDLDECVMRLRGKEREFKVLGRLFTIQTLKSKLAVGIAEHNIQEALLPDFPKLTMAQSKVKVRQRLFHITRKLRQGLTRVQMEIDLSSWNTMWRRNAVHSVGRRLNKMFGVHVFDVPHDYYSKCMVHLGSYHKPPGIGQMRPEESNLLWFDHEGGFEGITQKQWSVATTCMILRALKGLGVTVDLTGQGDNQLLTLTVPETVVAAFGGVGGLCREIQIRIEKGCNDVNQEAKPEETVIFENSVSYSKEFMDHGELRVPILKAASRVWPQGISDIPSIVDNIAAVYSGGIRLADTLDSPISAFGYTTLRMMEYMLGCQELVYIGGKQAYRATRLRLSDSTLLKLAMLPSVLGGLPTLPWVEFMYLGGPDPLWKHYESLIKLARHVPEAEELLRTLNDDSSYRAKVDPSVLIDDPFSIPLRRPANPSLLLKDACVDVMRGKCRNVQIAELLSCSEAAIRDQTRSTLMTMTPFFPLLAGRLYSETPPGLATEFTAKFSSTKTLRGIEASRSQELDDGELGKDPLIVVVVRGNKALVDATLLQIGEQSDSGIRNPREFVTWARGKWGVDIQGVTSTCPISGDLHTTPCQARVEAHFQQGVARGSRRPFFGKKTRETRRGAVGADLVGRDRGTVALRGLLRLSSVISPASQHIIVDIAETRLNAPFEVIADLVDKVIGGSIAHRLDTPQESRDCYDIGNPTFATRASFNTDNSGELSAGRMDVDLQFQECFLWLQAIGRLREARGLSTPYLCIDVESLDYRPIAKSSIDILAPFPSFVSVKGNPLVSLQAPDIRPIDVAARSVFGARIWSIPEVIERASLVPFIRSSALAALHSRRLGALTLANVVSSGTALEIDVLEVVKLGGDMLVQVMTEAIYVKGLELVTRVVKREDRNVYSTLTGLSLHGAQLIIQWLHHPQVANNLSPTVTRAIGGEMTDGVLMLSRLMFDRAKKMTSMEQLTWVVSQAAGDLRSNTLIEILARAWAGSLIAASWAKPLLTRLTTISNSDSTTETKSMEMVQALMAASNDERALYPHRLLDGSVITFTPGSIKEALRLVRELPDLPKRIRPTRMECRWQPLKLIVGVPKFSDFFEPNPVIRCNPLSVTRASYWKSHSRASIVSEALGSVGTIISVGVGAGGIASHSIKLGCKIIGVETRDYLEITHTPALVGCDPSFSWAPMCINHEYDSTPQSLARAVEGVDGLIVVDTNRNWLDQTTLLSLVRDREVVHRLSGSRQNMIESIATARCHWRDAWVLPYLRDEEDNWEWVLGTCNLNPSMGPINIIVVSDIEPIEVVVPVSVGDIVEAIAGFVTGSGDLHEAMLDIVTLYRELKGTYVGRLRDDHYLDLKWRALLSSTFLASGVDGLEDLVGAESWASGNPPIHFTPSRWHQSELLRWIRLLR